MKGSPLNDPAAPSLADRLTMTREGIRASMTAADKAKGPAAALEAIFLKLLDTLLTLLADFQAGRLPPLAPREAAPPPRPSPAEAGEGEGVGAPDATAVPHRGLLARVWGLAWPHVWGARRARWELDAAGAESATAGGDGPDHEAEV